MAGFVSAVSWYDSQPHLRVYTSNGSQVTEQAYDGSWYKGAFSAQGTTVGATSWLEGSQIHIRVYVAGTDGNVTEYCWDKDQWYVGQFQGQGTGAAATSWLTPDGQIHIRVYLRSTAGAFSEMCWDGNGWYKGAYPGA